MRSISRIRLTVLPFRVTHGFATVSVKTDSTTGITTAELMNAVPRRLDFMPKLMITASKDSHIFPGRKRETGKERKALRGSVAGSSVLKIQLRVSNDSFEKLTRLVPDGILGIAVFVHGSAVIVANKLVKLSDFKITDNDGRLVHQYLTAPSASGDYVIRLFSLPKRVEGTVFQYNNEVTGSDDDCMSTDEGDTFFKNQYYLVSTSSKIHVRGNALIELATTLSQVNGKLNITLSKLIALFEGIAKEHKIIGLLSGDAYRHSSVIQMSMESAKQLHLCKLAGRPSPSVKNVDVAALTQDEKLSMIGKLLVHSAEFVVHVADMIVCAQTNSWTTWQKDNNVIDLDSLQEIFSTEKEQALTDKLIRLIGLMVNNRVLCSELLRAKSKPIRVDLHKLSKDVGSSVVDLTGPQLLLRLQQLQSDFFPPLQVLRKPGVERNTYFLEVFGFVVDKYRPHSEKTLKALAGLCSASIDNALRSIQPHSNHFEKRMQFVQDLRKRLSEFESRSLPKEFNLSLFGSSGNGFGASGSDIDMNYSWSPNIKWIPEEVVEALGDVLTQMGMIDVEVRPQARTPLVLFRDPISGYQCDIALSPNNLAEINTELLRTYASIDPRVVGLGLLLKHWAKARKICDPQDRTLNSYTLILMMIQFLQMLPTPLLPSLQKLPPEWNGHTTFKDSIGCGGYEKLEATSEHNVYFFKAVTEGQKEQLKVFAARNTQSVTELLMGFFRFYGTQFNYRNEVISIRSGRTLSRNDKREDFGWPKKTTISVEDPFDTGFDTAHFVKEKGFNKVLEEFVRAVALVNRLHQHGQPGRELNYNGKDKLPDSVAPESFFQLLCEQRSASVPSEDTESV